MTSVNQASEIQERRETVVTLHINSVMAPQTGKKLWEYKERSRLMAPNSLFCFHYPSILFAFENYLTALSNDA